jgi:CheY-like chemotaxis protein
MRDEPVILLVEENEDDVFLIERSFQQAGIVNRLRAVRTGEQALAYLQGEGAYADREQHPLPRLVLLGLKLQRMDGFEVLRWIRQQPQFRELRVVIVTSPTDVRGVNVAFRFGATSFMIKPTDFMRFAEFSQALAGSWLWVEAVQDGSAARAGIMQFAS